MTGKTPLQRQTTTIMAADLVGYSRMMSEDDEGTVQTLKQYRGKIDELISRYQGRIFNTAGDSVMATFNSTVEAVRCAIAIQDDLRVFNANKTEDGKFLYRIGLTVGDVMVDGEDLLGDAVNIAARIEGICEPGNIFVSSNVMELIKGKLSYRFESRGKHTVKNISDPIETFSLIRKLSEVPHQSEPDSSIKNENAPDAQRKIFNLDRRVAWVGLALLPLIAFPWINEIFRTPSVSGMWEFLITSETTEYKPFQDLQITYKAVLVQRDLKIEGNGEKYSEQELGKDPFFYEAGGKVLITITGQIDKHFIGPDKIKLQIVEQGKVRTSTSFHSLTFTSDMTMAGRFNSTIARTSGPSEWKMRSEPHAELILRGGR